MGRRPGKVHTVLVRTKLLGCWDERGGVLGVERAWDAGWDWGELGCEVSPPPDADAEQGTERPHSLASRYACYE